MWSKLRRLRSYLDSSGCAVFLAIFSSCFSIGSGFTLETLALAGSDVCLLWSSYIVIIFPRYCNAGLTYFCTSYGYGMSTFFWCIIGFYCMLGTGSIFIACFFSWHLWHSVSSLSLAQVHTLQRHLPSLARLLPPITTPGRFISAKEG